MKKGILISLLALSLAACGGSSSSDSTTEIDQNFASSVKGIEQEPTLTSAVVSEGDVVLLNTNLTGSVLEDSSVNFTFTPTEANTIALILSSDAKDLDLTVANQGNDLESDSNSSNEALVFEVIAGQVYSINVASYEGSGDFQLKLVEANRSSLGLSSNEYFVIEEQSLTQVCVEDGESFTEETTSTENLIINWKDGYITTSSADNKTAFTSINDNSFTIVGSDSWSEDGESYQNDYTYTYNVNLETGALTGSLTSKSTLVSTYQGSNTEVCTSDVNITAQIVL